MIRPMGHGDRLAVFAMMRSFALEIGDPEADPIHAATRVDLCRHDDSAVAFVVDVDGDVCGVLAAQIGQSMRNAEPIASEIVLWIEPRARGPWLRPLVTRYQQWARAAGAVRCVLTARDERTTRVFARLGFRRAEISLVASF